MLSSFNYLKVFVKWMRTGENVTREEVERAIIELESEHEELIDDTMVNDEIEEIMDKFDDNNDELNTKNNEIH